MADIVDTPYFYDVVLSRNNRTNAQEGVTLVSINRNGRVTIRDSFGTLWHARKGEQFVSGRRGSEYSLKSVDLQKGRVVLKGMTRVYYDYSQTPPEPAMIVR